MSSQPQEPISTAEVYSQPETVRHLQATVRYVSQYSSRSKQVPFGVDILGHPSDTEDEDAKYLGISAIHYLLQENQLIFLDNDPAYEKELREALFSLALPLCPSSPQDQAAVCSVSASMPPHAAPFYHHNVGGYIPPPPPPPASFNQPAKRGRPRKGTSARAPRRSGTTSTVRRPTTTGGDHAPQQRFAPYYVPQTAAAGQMQLQTATDPAASVPGHNLPPTQACHYGVWPVDRPY
ncbi:hypothetical protein L227DRAFT_634045 [Lentinus tigrinus ALCF2SS1-6]|uniref:Uncharacterized protein n=1 Tax=Lentinus tigrinus ALCF2SS1-6 TaxID=1328759 RepID=A0A5C2RZR7_9APHY|nr:hypothetical protein L227DRAFT_634045 [Lentinus tigrinus ALCF2SS1-6]